jgi:hypothetical protein
VAGVTSRIERRPARPRTLRVGTFDPTRLIRAWRRARAARGALATGEPPLAELVARAAPAVAGRAAGARIVARPAWRDDDVELVDVTDALASTCAEGDG